jgi:ABC-type protease/lipase transport system fused ATPase/permease subunit
MSKTIDKSYKKATKEFFSRSTYVLVIIVELVVLGFVSLHPLNESLAQQIATALITVDGLILGFTILGVTVVAERGFSIPRMTAIFEEHFKELVDELKVVEASDAKKTAEKLTSSAESAIVDIVWVPSVLFIAMYFLLASLLSALMLFGVSDTTVGDPIFLLAFESVMGL